MVSKYFNSGVLLDTNLLILLLIGTYDPEKIQTFKRTRIYTKKDFKLLVLFLDKFKTKYTISTVLAECWNLLDGNFSKNEYEKLVEKSIKVLDPFGEDFIKKENIFKVEKFKYIGFTDISLGLMAKNKSLLILTDDLRAKVHLENLGAEVLNLNYIRFGNY